MNKVIGAYTLGDFIENRYNMDYNAAKQGIKYDQGKQRFDLIPFDLLLDEQKVWEYGAEKYEPNNWRKGMPMTQPLNAALRHLTSYLMGEDKDPESGVSHLAHALTSIRIAQNTEKYYPEMDDRQKWKFTQE